MVTVTVTAKFHQPTRSRRQEWQDAMLVYRDTKQQLVNGWHSGELEMSVTTAIIQNALNSCRSEPSYSSSKSRVQTRRVDGLHRRATVWSV